MLPQVVISDESPLVNVRLDDPVLQDVYNATVVGIRPAAHHLFTTPTPGTACGDGRHTLHGHVGTVVLTIRTTLR